VRRSWLLLILCAAAAGQRFVILGDRTGEAQPGVYEQAWREISAARPEFVVSVGDTIQGLHDENTVREWADWRRLMTPYARIPLYLTPGNHDIWSEESEALYTRNAGHPIHYSFDRGPAHFTILDNSRSESLSDAEMEFLESDLKAHAGSKLKFVVSHRPSWIVNAALHNTAFTLHRLAKQYGVRHVITGHVHKLIRIELDGVEYLSMPSAGGHLRASGEYKDGWFFGYTIVDARGGEPRFEIHELKAPHGEGRVTTLADWGMLGYSAK
jgi:DNA repair exonuclease SbcCD nuclease subunit